MKQLFFFFLFLLLTKSSFSQEFIKVCELKLKYNSNEKILLKISPLSKEYFVTIGLQKQNGSEWLDVANDITRTKFDNTEQVIFLSQTEKIIWLPNKMPQIAKKTKLTGLYKFVFKMGNEPNELNLIQYSLPFSLN